MRWSGRQYLAEHLMDRGRQLSVGQGLAETRGKPRTVQGQEVVETGSGKPGAIEELQSAPERYGLGPRVSMQASGTNVAASDGHTKPDAWSWTGKHPASQRGVHTRRPCAQNVDSADSGK